MCHPLFKDYPQVIHRGQVKEAFFWFEVKVVKLSDSENVVDSLFVVVKVGAGSDPDVVHVDSDGSAKGFVFKDDISIDVVHESLEHCW